MLTKGEIKSGNTFKKINFRQKYYSMDGLKVELLLQIQIKSGYEGKEQFPRDELKMGYNQRWSYLPKEELKVNNFGKINIK